MKISTTLTNSQKNQSKPLTSDDDTVIQNKLATTGDDNSP